MLSRLKQGSRRTASSSQAETSQAETSRERSTTPEPTAFAEPGLDGASQHEAPPTAPLSKPDSSLTPTSSLKSNATTVGTPARTGSDSSSKVRSLSPESAQTKRTNRSESFSSMSDRRGINYNIPDVNSRLFVANGPGSGGVGASNGLSVGMGEGSLSLDSLALGGGERGQGWPTPMVQAPELLNIQTESRSLPFSESIEDRNQRTPLATSASTSLFDIPVVTSAASLSPASAAIQAATIRARSSTIASENASTDRPSGLSALAALNGSSAPAASLSPGSENGASRPVSRSGSFNNEPRPDLTRPRLSPTATNKSLKKARSATGGIAAAIAASGVSLGTAAAPSQQLNRGYNLSRVSTRSSVGREHRRDSLETYDSDMYSQYGNDNSYSLGDLDDVVNQLGTGYAVASSKRNAEFHAIFKNIPDDDYLIEDYGCALQREILIQGRLYISEHHLSFNANIFGWVTSLTLPFSEVVSIEKRMTAYVIPNAIQVTTLHARHTFASFLSRDTTYHLIGNIWRMIHPVVPASAALPDHAMSMVVADDDVDTGSVAGDDDGGVDTKRGKRRLKGLRKRGESDPLGNSTKAGLNQSNGFGTRSDLDTSRRSSRPDLKVHPVTEDTCPTLKNLKEVCMDTVFPSAPEKIYNLMFTSGFMKDFWTNDQKLMELQISDWAPEKSGSNLLARSMSYIKPLNGSIGPKQTKCLLTDENAHVDFDDYVCVITTTRTPDVPSGSAFAVKTRTSMTWAKGNSCRVVVTSGVEWTKSSFIKGIIERSCMDGQRSYHVDLERAMRAYIQQHRSEFLEEGQEEGQHQQETSLDEVERRVSGAGMAGTDGTDASLPERRRESSVGLHMVVDTLSDLYRGLSPTSAALGAVILVLVLSNIWTFASRQTSTPSRHAVSRNSGGGGSSGSLISTSFGASGSPRHPDDVASAVRGALNEFFEKQAIASKPTGASDTVPISDIQARDTLPIEQPSTKAEAEAIELVLYGLEKRMEKLRESLAKVD